MRIAVCIILLLINAFTTSAQSITPSGTVNICIGESQELKVTSNAASYQWQLNGVNVNGAISQTLTVKTAGDYTVIINGGKNKGDTLGPVKVIVNPLPNPGFTFSNSNECGTVPVNFINTSTDGVSYVWNFGDTNSGSNNTSTAMNPSHRFVGIPGNSTQTFKVKLITKSAAGCVDSIEHSVVTKQLPDGSLGGNGAGTFAGKNYFKICGNMPSGDFTFTNQSKTSSTNTNYRIIWGDGSADFQGAGFNSLNHTYSIGTYKLLNIVSGSNGCIDTIEYSVFVGTNPAVGLGNPGNTVICSGSAISFPISSTESNPPGTIYTINFNDGSSPQVFVHPSIPSSISHVFNITSCGTDSYSGSNKLYSNSFLASIVASNPCNSSEATVVPIYVSEKPKADFDFIPKDTVCVSTKVTLQNKSVSSSADNGACKEGPIIWSISPATGWTITSGDFGKDFGFTNPSLWQTGSEILNVNFTQPGVYSISIKTGNGFCGINEITKKICVNPDPVVSYNLDVNEGCAPLKVSTTTTANSPTCSTNKFVWKVNYSAPTGCGNVTGNYTYLNGTNSGSSQPVFQFNDPGIYSLELVMVSPGGTCSTAVIKKIVTVKGKPQVSVTGIPTTICQKENITPKASVNCFIDNSTTYSWLFPGGNPSVSQALIPGTIQMMNAGQQDISLTVTNSCGATSVNTPITVNATPEITLPADIISCSGETIGPITLSSSPATTAWSWSNNNTGIGLSASGSSSVIPIFTSANSGTSPVVALINTTAKIGTCSSSKSFKITINPKPSPPQVQNVAYCRDEQAQPLTATSTSGNSLVWYTSANGGTGNGTAPTPLTNVAGITTYYVSQVSQSTHCEGNRVPISVTIHPIPNIVNFSSVNPDKCATSTGSITLLGLDANKTYQVNYSRNGIPVVISLSADAAGSLIISNLSAATYSDIYVVSFGCPSNKMGPIILSDPNPPAAPEATASNEICSGNTLKLFAKTSLSGNIAFSWSGPNGFTSPDQNPVISNASKNATGTYFVTITQNNCTSAPGKVMVTVYETPAISMVTSNSPICSGNTLNLSSNSSYSGSLTYAWTGPGGFTADIQNPSIVNSTPANSGTYQLVITSGEGNCKSAPVQTVAVINPTPNISGATKMDPVNCASATGSITLSGLFPNKNFEVNYLKNGIPIKIDLASDVSGQVIISNLTSGNYTNIFVSITNCTSNVVGPLNLTDPNPPEKPEVKNNGPLCVGKTLVLTAETTLSGAIIYNWSGPGGFTSSLQNPTINSVTTSAGGLYSLTVTQNNCTSAAATTNVVIHTLPSAPVTAPLSYCLDEASIPLSATGNSLLWYNTISGGTGSATAPVPVTSTAGITNYYVTQTDNNGCESERALLSVTIHPNAIADFSPKTSIDCPPFRIGSDNINLHEYPSNNSQYNWYINGVFAGSGIQFPGYTIVGANDSVIVKLITTSLFGCKSDSLSHKFSTPKLPNPSFTIDKIDGCGPLSVLITNTTEDIGLYNYQWDFGNGQTSNAVQPGNVVFLSNPTYRDTIYQVKLKIVSICDTLVLTKDVHVKSKPKALFTPDLTTGCSPMKVRFKNTSKGIGNTYYWNFGDGHTSTTNNLDVVEHTFYTSKVDTFYVRLIAVNECGNDTLRYAVIAAPNNIKLNFAMNGPDHFGCIPHTVAFINNTSGASSFQWDFGDGNTLSTTKNIDTIYHTYIAPGDYTVSLRAQNNCADTSTIDHISVYPKPNAGFKINNSRVCIGESILFSNLSELATSYAWDFGDGTTSVLENPTHVYKTPGLYTVKLMVFKLNAPGSTCIDSSEQIVQVVSSVTGNFTMSGDQSACAPFKVTFENLTRPSVTANWDFGDGTNSSGDSVSHTYKYSGVYTVSLTVTVAGGCTYVSSKTITINGPSGTLNYTGGNYCYPNKVRLEAVATNTDLYHWNFGDGNTLETSQPVVYHLYENPGSYLPILSLSNNGGCNYIIAGSDSVNIDRLDAGFTIGQQKTCGSTMVTFSDTSHVFSGKSLVRWNFGDGNTTTGGTAQHIYNTSGNYWIEMIIESKNGCIDTVRRQIEFKINSKPNTSISANDEGCESIPTIFTGTVQSIDPIKIQEWTISNGAKATGASLNYSFIKSGTYTIRLITGTENGCFDTAFHSILIKPSPVVKAGGDVTLCKGTSVQLHATGAINYQWSPLQGLSCTDCANPLAVPEITTPYVVAGFNNLGCPGYDTVNVTVIQPLKLSTSGNDSICIGQSANLLVSGAQTYAWNPAADLSSTTISNPIASPKQTTTYRVIGYDGHHCFSDTAFIVVAVGQKATVKLPPDQTLATGTLFPLETIVTNGPVKYWVWTPPTDLDCSGCPQPTAHIKNDITYVVDITTAYGCKASDSINIKVFCKSAQVFIPNAFSPDGDGINDILMVRATGIVSVKSFRIFNRWGELIFERNNFKPNEPSFGWDGKIRGKPAGPEVYVYTAEVLCENGVSFIYKGNTTLLK